MSSRTSKPRTFPSIPWGANDKKLVHELLDKLKENDAIRRGIWPKKGEKISSHKKAFHHRNLAQKLLKDVDTIKDVIDENNARTHYGTAVKNQLGRMEKTWKNAKITLGITGAGLPNEDSIWDGPNEIRTKWEEVQEICPWFFRMKELVGDRFDDIGAAISNSEMDVTLNTAQSGDRRHKDKDEGSGLEEILDNGDEEDDDLEEGEISQSNNALTTHRSSGTYNIPIRPASSPPPIQTPGLVRRKSGVMSDLTEGLRQVATLKNERKRLHDMGVEDTKRLEIKEKSKIEQRRLDLEERRIVLEEKRLAMQIGRTENSQVYHEWAEGNEGEDMEI